MKKAYSEEDLVKNLSLYYMNRHLRKKPIQKYHREIDASSLHERDKYRKKEEILLLNSFLHHFPQIQFENLTCESPDFIASINNKTIGIELTEVINHLDMKKMESQMNKIFRQCEIILEQINTAKFRGVYFLEFKDIRDLNFEMHRDEITEHIYKSILHNRCTGVVKRIKKSPHRRNVFITHDFTMGLFDELESEKIIHLIEKKNEKYPFYDHNVDECWLVIVSDMNSLSCRYTFIENKENLKNIDSPFDKIFHIENLCGNMLHIK